MRFKELKKVTVSEFLFFSAWILFVATLILGSTAIAVDNDELKMLLKLVRYGAYALFFLKIMREGLIKKNIVPLLLVFLAFMLSYVHTHNTTMPLYCLVLFASMGIHGDKIIKTTAWLQGIFLFFTVLLSQFGVLEDYIFDASTRMRHGLGFSWTTTGPILFFYFTLCLIYIKRNAIKTGMLLLLEIINIVFYKLTDSRLAFVLLSTFLAFILIQNSNKNKWKILSHLNVLYILFPFMMELLSIAIVKMYDETSPLWMALNKLLSGRLKLGKSALDTYGLGLLGNDIEWIGFNILRPTKDLAVGYNYVDSSYLQLTVNFGLIFMIAVLTIYAYGIYKATKINDYYLVMIYVCVLTFAFTEPRMLNFAYNPFPLLAFGYVGNHRITGEKGNYRRGVRQ